MTLVKQSLTVFIVLGLALAAGCKNAPGTSAVDQSTPKAAAISFAKAVKAGDGAGIRATSIGTDAQYQAIESLGQFMNASFAVRDAAEAKFGKDNLLSKRLSDMPDLAASAEKCTFTESGDTATMKERENDPAPTKLTKVDGKWKLDLSTMPMKSAATDPTKMAEAAKGLNELASDIKSGKVATAEAAAMAMAAKMMQVK